MIPDARYGRRAIAWLARFGRDRTTLLIVVLAGLGTAHLLVRTAPYGTAVDPDSTFFLSTALNFLAGEGWRDFTGEPLTLWPPLFPLLLVAGGWVGIEPLEAGRWINATAFGLTILAAGGWLRSNLRSWWLTLATTAIIAASVPLNHWASNLMAEPLFVLFTILALSQLGAFLNRQTAAPLWWATVFTALAAITRYPGVVLIGTGVLVLLLPRARPLAARLKDAIVFGAVSSMPLAGVLTHNWAISGTLTGPRNKSRYSPSDLLSRVEDTFRDWMIPPNTPDGLGYLLWMVAGLVVLAAGAVVVWSGRSAGKGGPSPSFGLGPALPFGVFAVGYFVFIVAVVPFTIPGGINFRFLVPVYVPLLLVAVFLLDRFPSIKASGWTGAVRYGLASLVVLGALAHLGFSAQENLRRTAHVYKAGYRDRDWLHNAALFQHSETLNYIRDNHIEGRIYSNTAVEFVWFWDRTAAVRKVRTYRNIPHRMEWAEIEAGAHIVWLNRLLYDREDLGYDELDFRFLPGIEIVAELPDGLVLRRTASEPFDEDRHRARKQHYIDQLIQQADERVVRSGWTVYRTGRTLIYRKKPCAPADTQAKFILHIVPADPADLPAHRQQYGSENLDFYFKWTELGKSLGFRLGDQCIAIAHLPTYAIDRIHVGQWIPKEDRTLWEAELTPSR